MSYIIGADSLLRKLNNIENIDLTTALNKACLVVENDAKIACPVDTGELRNSITHEVKDNKGTIGTNKEYAPYVEIGTGIFSSEGTGRQDRWSYQDVEGNWHSTIGQKPQPFLKPALDKNRVAVEKLLKDEVRKELKKNAKH